MKQILITCQKIFVCLLLSLVSINGFSQGYETSYKTTDLALAAGKGFSSAMPLTQMFGVSKLQYALSSTLEVGID